ncbi:anti-sigma regulatory factor [Methylicorpusculum sp.]|uniref:anti-sigma regulatory factor n=1 Tax=Methylicorpusculum sp. TaxID=2713644 RepID=UPI00271C0940|nr:anti-sigma regulatory factor [Methylicorpusculum sp.]MDO8844840.1 anti-sigma regulatory factor [Methylicorpusculum sp.]
MSKVSVQVLCESDIAEASRQARLKSKALGFARVQRYYLATAASELASNLFIHSGGGVLEMDEMTDRPGIALISSDNGPGIADVEQALEDGYSTVGGLGCGLPGVKRLMDEFIIESQVGIGTVVKAYKWL